MSWSLGETQTLAVKAARGSGFPWGLAEEAGFSVRWLQAHGLPGAAALAGYLVERDKRGKVSLENCPLVRGTRISDSAASFLVKPFRELPGTAYPLLLVPFIANAAAIAKTQKPLLLEWAGAAFQIIGCKLTFRAEEFALLTVLADCHLDHRRMADVTYSTSATRVPNSAANVIEHLEGFAAHTYAPATEKSRLTGAGAGASDSD